MFSCASKHHIHESKKSIFQHGAILQKIISENDFRDKCTLSGQIIENKTKDVLPYALILFSNHIKNGKVESDLNGNFAFTDMEEGYYKIQVSYVGYSTFSIDSLYLEKGKRTFVKIGLEALVL